MGRVDATPVKNDATLNYTATFTGARFHSSPAFMRVLLGPVGSGKSSATWLELFRRACETDPDANGVRAARHLCIRDTYAMLKTTTIQDYLSWFSRMGAEVVYDAPIRGRLRIPLPDGTSLDWNLWFLSMDGGEKSLDILRGMAISGAYINEGHSIAKEVYEVVTTRIGRYSTPDNRTPKWKGIVVDSNYGYAGCYLHHMYVHGAANVDFFEQPPAAIYNQATGKFELNPNADNIAHLPGGFDYYEKMLGLSQEFVKQFLANQWATKQSGKAVYPQFTPFIHMTNGLLQPDPMLPLLIGMDFGLNVAATLGQLSRFGKLVVFQEVVGDDVDLETFTVRHLVPVLRSARFAGMKSIVCGDPAGLGRSSLDKRTAYDVLRKHGIAAYPAPTNEFASRRGAVSSFLDRNNGFSMVAPDCPRLLEGFEGGYGFKKKSDNTGYHDYVDKNKYSHVHDALQYMALFAKVGPKRWTAPAEVDKKRRLTGSRGNPRNAGNRFTG